jgi:hypothetical protein
VVTDNILSRGDPGLEICLDYSEIKFGVKLTLDHPNHTFGIFQPYIWNRQNIFLGYDRHIFGVIQTYFRIRQYGKNGFGMIKIYLACYRYVPILHTILHTINFFNFSTNFKLQQSHNRHLDAVVSYDVLHPLS